MDNVFMELNMYCHESSFEFRSYKTYPLNHVLYSKMEIFLARALSLAIWNGNLDV